MIETVKFEGVEYDAVRLLMALHNNSKPAGMGFLHAGPDLTEETARQVLQSKEDDLARMQREWGRADVRTNRAGFSFDYLFGRPIKVTSSVDGEITAHSEHLYDRDAGEGQFRKALEFAKAGK